MRAEVTLIIRVLPNEIVLDTHDESAGYGQRRAESEPIRDLGRCRGVVASYKTI